MAPATQAPGVETRLTDHGAWPDISGERVVWRQSGPEGKLVMLLNLSTGERSVLANGHRLGDRAVISGTRVAWHDTDSQDAAAANITVADLSTGTLTELRTEANQAFPALLEDRVLWEDRFVGQAAIDIVLFEFR